MSKSHSAQTRLASYGTLAPGRANHHVMDGMVGHWRQGVVRGYLKDIGWGAAMGYPGILLDPDGPDVAVHIFESHDLRDHWERLDAFEGDGYRRTITTAATSDGQIEVSIYEAVQA